MDYFKKLFVGRKIPFYISCGAALLVLVTSILYAAYFFTPSREQMGDYVSWLVPVILAGGVILFLGLTALKLSRIGTALLSACTFAGFVVYVRTVFGFVVENIMNSIPEIPTIIVCAAFMLVGFIVTNVTAWLKHD